MIFIDRLRTHTREYQAEVADPDPARLKKNEGKYYGRQLDWQIGGALSMLAGAYVLYKTGNPEGLEIVPVAATTISFIGSCAMFEFNGRKHDVFLDLLDQQATAVPNTGEMPVQREPTPPPTIV